MLWSIPEKKPYPMNLTRGKVEHVVFSPDSDLLVLTIENSMFVINTRTQQIINSFRVPKIRLLQFSTDGNSLISINDYEVTVFQVNREPQEDMYRSTRWKIIASYKLPVNTCWSLSLSKNNKTLCVYTTQKVLAFYEFPDVPQI